MAFVIAQISDVHIGGSRAGTSERFSDAVDAINSMTSQPDLVLVTGDITDHGEPAEWGEFRSLITPLIAPWEAIRGNHDRRIEEFAGHRSLDLGELHLVLVDTSADTFDDADAEWLDADLTEHRGWPTVIAIHHPPFETGIWWMDCVGLRGAERFEAVVRRHPQVLHVMSGHVHRPITTAWGSCLLTVCPSTSGAVAGDLDPRHEPAETREPPMIAMHAYVGDTVVTHVVAVGPAATRTPISTKAPEFVAWAKQQQTTRTSRFAR